MKKISFILLLLAATIALELRVPESVQIQDSGGIDVFVSSEQEVIVSADWINERVDIFPSQLKITPVDGGATGTFRVFAEPSACGTTQLLLNVWSERKNVSIKLRDCANASLIILPNPADLPVDNEFSKLKRNRLDIVEKYLQLSPPLEREVETVEDLISQLKEETDFMVKTQLGDQANLKIIELKNTLPYILVMSESIEPMGENNLKDRVGSEFGELEESPLLMYKRRVRGQAQSGGASPEVVPFTFYSIRIYNPTSESMDVLLIEGQPHTRSNTKASLNRDVSAWQLKIGPNSRTAVTYMRNSDVGANIPTAVFKIKPKPQEQPPTGQPPVTPSQPSEPEEPSLLSKILSTLAGLFRSLGLEFNLLANKIEK